MKAMSGAIGKIGEAAGGDEKGDEFCVGKDDTEYQKNTRQKKVIAIEEFADAAEQGENSLFAELGHGDEGEQNPGRECDEGEEGEDGGVAVIVDPVPERFERSAAVGTRRKKKIGGWRREQFTAASASHH